MSPDLDSVCQTEWGPRADANGVTQQNCEQGNLLGYGGFMKWGTRKLVSRKGRRVEMSSEALDRAGLVGDHEIMDGERRIDHESPPTRDTSPCQDPVSPSALETSPRSRRSSDCNDDEVDARPRKKVKRERKRGSKKADRRHRKSVEECCGRHSSGRENEDGFAAPETVASYGPPDGETREWQSWEHELRREREGFLPVFDRRFLQSCEVAPSLPRFLTSLSRLEKEDDVHTICGGKLSQRPRRRSKGTEKLVQVSGQGRRTAHTWGQMNLGFEQPMKGGDRLYKGEGTALQVVSGGWNTVPSQLSSHVVVF